MRNGKPPCAPLWAPARPNSSARVSPKACSWLLPEARPARLLPSYDKSGAKGIALRLAFADRVLAALRQLPGVQSSTVTSVAPLTGETWVDTISRPDHPVPAGKEPRINVRWIDSAYLPTMQT